MLRDGPPLQNQLAPAVELIGKLRETAQFLEAIAADRSLLDDLSVIERERLLHAAGQVYCSDPDERRRRAKVIRRRRVVERVSRDQTVLAASGIRSLRTKPVYLTPNVFPTIATTELAPNQTDAESREVRDPRHCYICKVKFARVHHFYDQLCAGCADLNYRKRSETADLGGRVALLSGGRVKIGYQTGIKLLRAGAQLIVTTRFPRDAAARYATEADFEDWRDRLEIFGLDLRHTPSVEAFCAHLTKTRSRLDFIINNACQTVRRPPEFYRHMIERETASLHSLPQQLRPLLGAYEGLRGDTFLPVNPSSATSTPGVDSLLRSAELSQLALLPGELDGRAELFPKGRLDQDLQQVDLREHNSWRMLLADVSSVELLETQLINAIAPFVLNARLKPLMLTTPERDKHVVNVSAVEGQFYRKLKTTRHPHTNMAKAALNMMTRTSAAEFHADGIHMNSVDTGWVSDEDVDHIARQKTAEHHFHPPLDIVDGAARIVDPIIDGFNTGTHVWGQFLKDYRPTDW